MMSFIAREDEDFETWDYIIGNVYLSILEKRYSYLMKINCDNPIKVALRDPSNDYWSKWLAFPGLLTDLRGVTEAIDVHRSILKNEIIIESDYPTYEENYEAAKVIGRIIEKKGFQPLYYYSGNKSIHVHIFFDWGCIKMLNSEIKTRILQKFDVSGFQKRFIEYLRAKMISCWDTNVKKFDKDLIKATHLIRCELSKNKKGYKTFLGYTYRDMSFVPYVCNEQNRIYPQLGEIRLSAPDKIQEIVEEFLDEIDIKEKRKKMRMRGLANRSPNAIKNSPKEIRWCVKAILSEDFKKYGDGFQRGMFILLNELRRVMGDTQARIIINDWNGRMGFPVKDKEIDYRFGLKNYSLTCEYIHNFLKEIGIDISKKCKGKIYK